MQFNVHKDGIQKQYTNNRHVNLVQNVSENKAGYKKIQLKNAKLAREIYAKVGNPSQKDFKNLIKYNIIRKCPGTIEDTNRADKYTDPPFTH